MTNEIRDYDPAWVQFFNQEKELLTMIFGDDVCEIEHVGSTAIPSQRAKPIIDIFLAVSELKEKEYYGSKLFPEYIYLETDMKNSYLFHKKGKKESYNIHIMCFDKDFKYLNEILFRDYLGNNQQRVEDYGRLKDELVSRYGLSLEYTKGKTEFIQKVIEEKGLPSVSVWE
jgi:GrpB-like predicted nucleotidyltransferase (UPF0157 family)